MSCDKKPYFLLWQRTLNSFMSTHYNYKYSGNSIKRSAKGLRKLIHINNVIIPCMCQLSRFIRKSEPWHESLMPVTHAYPASSHACLKHLPSAITALTDPLSKICTELAGTNSRMEKATILRIETMEKGLRLAQRIVLSICNTSYGLGLTNVKGCFHFKWVVHAINFLRIFKFFGMFCKIFQCLWKYM